MESIVLSLLVLVTIISSFFFGVHSAKLTIINNCPYTIWPATLTGSGQQTPTGFELAHGASNSFDVIPTWSGRIWARTECSTDQSGKFFCNTGDCGLGQVACDGAGGAPPVSLVEFTVGGSDNKDFYDVSLVDGFNLPVTLAPESGNCKTTSCPVDVNAKCPPELSVGDSGGAVIACKSACLAFNQPQYCCSGAYSSPQTCPPTQYSKFFKSLCPQAYSYAFDDPTSTFTCKTGETNYSITFCP